MIAKYTDGKFSFSVLFDNFLQVVLTLESNDHSLDQTILRLVELRINYLDSNKSRKLKRHCENNRKRASERAREREKYSSKRWFKKLNRLPATRSSVNSILPAGRTRGNFSRGFTATRFARKFTFHCTRNVRSLYRASILLN